MNKITAEQLFKDDLLELPTEYRLLYTSQYEESKHVLPDGGGVYTFLDGTDRVLYIGKAKNVKSRVTQHLKGGPKGNANIHAKFKAGEPMLVTYYPENNIVYQDLYESYLIYRNKPLYNKQKRESGYSLSYKEGATAGRPPLNKDIVDEAVRLYLQKEQTVKEITALTGISKATLYRKLKKMGIT